MALGFWILEKKTRIQSHDTFPLTAYLPPESLYYEELVRGGDDASPREDGHLQPGHLHQEQVSKPAWTSDACCLGTLQGGSSRDFWPLVSGFKHSFSWPH